MLKTWLTARPRNKGIFAILLAALVFLLLFFLWLIKDEVRMMLVAEPETCALCDGQPHDVPCLLDISSGQVGGGCCGGLRPGPDSDPNHKARKPGTPGNRGYGHPHQGCDSD